MEVMEIELHSDNKLWKPLIHSPKKEKVIFKKTFTSFWDSTPLPESLKRLFSPFPLPVHVAPLMDYFLTILCNYSDP
jgi:hypothetical protein